MQNDYSAHGVRAKKELADCVEEEIASLQKYRRGFNNLHAKDFIQTCLKKAPLAGEVL
jgi:hypothetical protein